MDADSHSSKGELDSLASADSLQKLADEFRLQHLSTPDVTNAELSKRVAALELDNDRLRIDLENARLELSAKNAANQGLKEKIAELYVEARTSLQERQKLQNALKDVQCRLAVAESSTNWYQGQMHEVQANKQTLQIEIDTYQNMLRQKSHTLLNVSAKYKQLNEDYSSLVQKHKKEKDVLQAEINSIKNCSLQPEPQSTVPMSAYNELSGRLELAEEELRESRAELRSLEERLRRAEEERAEEATAANQRVRLAGAEESLRRTEAERAQGAETCRKLGTELAGLRSEAAGLQAALLATCQEREQVEQAIDQLRTQLSKMIGQHRLLRSRAAQLEEQLGAARKESDRLRPANDQLLARLGQESRRIESLRRQLCREQTSHRLLLEKCKNDASLRDCLRQTLERNRELREQLKSAKASEASEECIDEGYADGGSLSLASLPSPRPLSPALLSTINDLLARSKNFWEPIKLGLDELQAKLESCGRQEVTAPVMPNTCCMPTPPSSPSSSSRSVA